MNESGNANEMESPLIEVERKFVPTVGVEQVLIESGACLVRRERFTDSYVDNTDWTLTLRNHWLRRRDRRWELKCPLAVSAAADVPPDTEFDILTQRYLEVFTEPEIISKVSDLMEIDGSSLCSVNDLLLQAGLLEFAKFTTERQCFKLPAEVTVVLDRTDFGWSVGELEIMCRDQGELEQAVITLEHLTRDLRLEIGPNTIGKMSAYLRQNNPAHYKKLLEAHVLFEK
uniref:Thiamine triphosphatase n=1 Tax=Eptatretus burgeri TaxID=7764 RepID=A0A8C4QIP3_EPTBU